MGSCMSSGGTFSAHRSSSKRLEKELHSKPIKELMNELDRRNINTTSMIEKDDLVKALVHARILDDVPIKDLKSELHRRNIPATNSMIEKDDLVKALVEARVRDINDDDYIPLSQPPETAPTTPPPSTQASRSSPKSPTTKNKITNFMFGRRNDKENINNTNGSSKRTPPPPSPQKSSPKKKKKKAAVETTTIPRKTEGKLRKSAASQQRKPQHRNQNKIDKSKWKCEEIVFDGSTQYKTMGNKKVVEGESLDKVRAKFAKNPNKYLALTYQSSMVDWPVKQQEYTLIERDGTVDYKPVGLTPNGRFTCMLMKYQRCKPFHNNNEFPPRYRDKYTDTMSYEGKLLHSSQNQPIMPGRGMGLGDDPLLKIIGDVDPSDIHQGSVGDCWLLSAISALAEFDGAIKRLFRKTPNLYQMPMDEPNVYTVCLYDLTTWREVDVVIDERLPVQANGSGQLLGASPSEDGELWVCYLEKALAVHCGGWDKIKGGQCTHGWALMTGCKHQYTIRKNPKTGKYQCFGKYNPNTRRWLKHGNSPHDGEQSVWPVCWPAVGGGGDFTLELTQEELFMRMCAWDDENYIVGASVDGSSDKNQRHGMVENHAYSVIEAHNDVAGTDIDLFKVRNPWGNGEIENGEFDDDGPGWDKYPQVKRALKPVVADDGIFYLTKQEFFHYFSTIYLSASNMTEFLED